MLSNAVTLITVALSERALRCGCEDRSAKWKSCGVTRRAPALIFLLLHFFCSLSALTWRIKRVGNTGAVCRGGSRWKLRPTIPTSARLLTALPPTVVYLLLLIVLRTSRAPHDKPVTRRSRPSRRHDIARYRAVRSYKPDIWCPPRSPNKPMSFRTIAIWCFLEFEKIKKSICN